MRVPTVRFPRGFLLSVAPTDPPPGFIRGPVLEHFYVHPWANVPYATDRDGKFVVIIGLLVSGVSEHETVPPAEALLWALQGGEGDFLRALDRYTGRFVIIYGQPSAVRVLTDATAMRSLFYADEGGVVSSHALLVERALGGEIVNDDLPFRYGYPGNRTPYRRVRLLSPNTLYDITAGKVRRFWPTRTPPDRTVSEAAAVLLDRAVTALRNLTRSHVIKMALTAGLDSRTLLAIGLRSRVQFDTYTYGDGNDTLLDRKFAVDLADSANVPHTLVPQIPLDEELLAALQEAHYSGHHRKAVASLSAWIDNPLGAAAVTGNLLEIGRSFYIGRRRAGAAPPVEAEAMAALHHHGMGKATKAKIDSWGYDRYMELATQAFQGFIHDTDLAAVAGTLDPFDQFYWEHRMGAWHGTAMVERDFYAEAFIPFNSRPAFEAMLGVPQADRDSGAVQRHLIRSVDERLLELPINPKRWPIAT